MSKTVQRSSVGSVLFILALFCLAGCSSYFPQLGPVPTRTKICYWGNHKTLEFPEQSREWRAKLEKAGIQANNVHFMAFGETSLCNVGGTSEPEELIPQFVELELDIAVNNLEDEAVLVDLLTRILVVIDRSRKEAPIQTVSLTFKTEQSGTKVLQFNSEQALQLQKQGLTNKDLLGKLEKKITPKSQ